MTIVQKIAIWALPVLFAITVHEVAHGWVASKFGDQTARLAGRLTLNPVSHVDLIGTIVVPIIFLVVGNFVFGWAKPVPVDARNMKNPKIDMAIVALAGPLANLLMALFWAGIAKIGIYFSGTDGWFSTPLFYMGQAGIMINVVLAVLNFLPIPPLDGGQILEGILPNRMGYYLHRFAPYGFLVLILLMLTGILSYIIGPPIIFIVSGIRMLFGI